MECSLAPPSSLNPILTDSLEIAEKIQTAEEGMDPEMAQKSATGCLQSEGKSYLFLLEQKSSLPKEILSYFDTLVSPLKGESLKERCSLLTIHENPLKEEDSEVNEGAEEGMELQESLTYSAKQQREPSPANRVHTTLHSLFKELSKPRPASPQTPSARAASSMHATTLEHRLKATTKESSTPEPEAKREGRSHLERGESERAAYMANSENVKDQEKQKRQDEEEGFAEGQTGKDQQQEEREKNPTKVEAIDPECEKELVHYGSLDSILAELLHRPVSQFDVLLLFIEILKLEIRGREQERTARWQERELQLIHMQNVVENYKSQGKTLLFSSIAAGVFGIVSGLCYIVGHFVGEWGVDKLSMLSSRFEGMKPEKAFESISKMTDTMAKMSENTGRIQEKFSESNRFLDESLTNLYRTEHEETTRRIEDIKEAWKGIENFLYQLLQMYHDMIRQLYGH